MIWDGPDAEINEWNGTAYVSVENSITTIQNYATLVLNNDPETNAPANYTTTNALTIGSANASDGPGEFAQQAGTLTTGGLTILSNGTLFGAPTVVGNIVNDGMIMASSGEMILQGSVTGTGTLSFDTTAGITAGTLDVQAIGTGESVALLGNDTLVIGSPGNFKGTISSVGTNTVMLTGIVANSGTWTGGTLDLYNSGSLVDAIAMTGGTSSVSVSSTGGNTDVSLGGIVSPPTLTAGASVLYGTGGSPVPLDIGLTITDAESTTLTSATISISSGFLVDDELAINVEPGITNSYDAATGVLTLTGTASLSTYQTALESVTYSTTNADPTNSGADAGRTVTWSINDGQATATATSTLSISTPGGATAEILFQNDSGQLAEWQVNGTTLASYGALGPNPGSDWLAMGTGAFFTGDTSDIVWQNENGEVAVWQVTGTTLGTYGVVGANPGTSWHIKGTGDFYGDGNTDVLWQNDNGSVALWDLNGTSLVQYGELATNPGTSWHVEGTGDFYGDGNTDVLFQNDDGSVALWDLNGTTLVQYGEVSANPGTDWHIVGTGKFFSDGNTDVVWQNDNGSVALWDLNGTTLVQAVTVGNPGSTWHVTAASDGTTSGSGDIVLQNSDGTVQVWEMNGGTIESSATIMNPGSSWNVLGSDDNMRFIYSGSAGETLAATPTTPDEFVFTTAASGEHTIAGFNPLEDMIALSATQFASFTDVQSAATAVAGGTMINLGNSTSLYVQGINPSALNAHNIVLS